LRNPRSQLRDPITVAPTGAETAKADSPQLAHGASGMTVALTSQGGNVRHGLRAARDL